MESSTSNYATYLTEKKIKKWVDPVLALFEPNCERRNSLARTFRSIIAGEVDERPSFESNKKELKDVITKNKDRIIVTLTTVACLRDTETPRAAAEAIYAEIAEKFSRL